MTIIQSITIDSGATGNMIYYSVVKWLSLPLAPSSQSAHQAKGSSPHQGKHIYHSLVTSMFSDSLKILTWTSLLATLLWRKR